MNAHPYAEWDYTAFRRCRRCGRTSSYRAHQPLWWRITHRTERRKA